MDLTNVPLLPGLLLLPIIWTLLRPMERFVLMRALWRMWPIVRPIIGWLCIGLGILGIILPILQGIIFLVIGAALIGTRHPLVRWTRVRYRQVLRACARSQHRLLRWIGIRGQRALRALSEQIKQIHQRVALRSQKRRHFRVALVPATPVCHTLNHWRRRYDPAYRNHLPPHIVVVATSCSEQRPQFEQHLAALCATLEPFQVTLERVALCEYDHRVVGVVGAGDSEIICLRDQIALFADPGLRFSQRTMWPSLTLAKLRHHQSLRSSYMVIEAEFVAQTWLVSELVLLEERIGHIWRDVRHFSLNHHSITRSNEASSLIVEEAT